MKRIVLLVALAGCTKGDTDTDVEIPVNIGPTVEFTPPAEAIAGEDLAIALTATDSDGVDRVTMFYKDITETAWDTIYLDRDGDAFSGTVPGAQVRNSEIELYFRAQDASDIHASTYLPADGQSAPFAIPVRTLGAELPFTADFENTSGGYNALYETGFDQFIAGFPGYNWDITGVDPHSGDDCAEHTRGFDGMDATDDWLISPPISLTGQDAVQLTWWERGDYADSGVHELYISTTGAEPPEGWTLVQALANPVEDTWTRTPIIDLSAYGGQEAVWLAWRYQGQFSDEWAIDDVLVRDLVGDVVFEGASVDTDPIAPGDHFTIALDVSNPIDVATETLTIEWEIPDGAGTIEPFPTEATLQPLSDGTWIADVELAADYPDNTWLPYTVTVSDELQTWVYEDRILVGDASTASIDYTQATDGLVRLTLGVGDVDDPEAEWLVLAEVGVAGTHHVDVDLTEANAFLPPGPGLDRWWLDVNAATSGALTGFTLSYDGQTYVSDDLGNYVSGTHSIHYLPRPPEIELYQVSTSSTPAPGGSVDATLYVQNVGAPTAGDTTATLSSSDPDVTITAAGPQTLSVGAFGEGSIASGLFSFDVAATHTSSTPVELELVVSDPAESWLVPVTVDVPWPVFRVTAVEIDDFTGNDDGVVDPGETVGVGIDLTNIGDLGSTGGVSCTMSVISGPAVITTATDSFSLIGAGQTKNGDFGLTASGSAGDLVQIGLACNDNVNTYATSFDFTLGDPLWNLISPLGDDPSDAVGGDFDFTGGEYRVVNGILQLRLESSTDFDPNQLFIEAWGQSTAAPYSYYQILAQGTNGRLRGYSLGVFTSLSDPTITILDDRHVQIDIDVASMNLILDQLSLGFGTGFCGGTDYYCDHFPDDWGDPYNVGFRDWLWADLSW